MHPLQKTIHNFVKDPNVPADIRSGRIGSNPAFVELVEMVTQLPAEAILFSAFDLAIGGRGHDWGLTTINGRNKAVEVRSELQMPICGVTTVVDHAAQMVSLPDGRCAYLIPPKSYHQFQAREAPGILLSVTLNHLPDGGKDRA